MLRLSVPKNDGNFADDSATFLPDGDNCRVGFGEFILDRDRGCLTRDGSEVVLRPKTYELLAYFVDNAGRLISKDELMDELWPHVVVTDDSLVKCVAELRKAIEDDGHQIIRTVTRRGYRFEVHPTDVPNIASRGPWRPQPVQVCVLLGLVLAMAATAWYLILNRTTSEPFSIVVLPFKTHGYAANQDYIGESLASDLTAEFARLPGFFIISHATARRISSDNHDVREIGRRLNVRYILSGNIEQTIKAVRIKAELVSAESGAVLWADRLVSPHEQVSASRDEIIGRIATALNFKLTRLESQRSKRERPDDPKASDLTFHGWSLIYSGKQPANYSRARNLFRQALQHDPRAVNALAGIGWTSAIMVLDGWSKSPRADIRFATDAVTKVLAIEPEHVVAHHVRGFLFRLQRRPLSARDAFRTVVALNPNYAPGHAQLGITELELGRPAAVLPAVQRAMRLSPRDPSLGPWLAFVGMAELHRGNSEDAIRWLKRAIDTGTPVARHKAYLASALALAGRKHEAQKVLAAMVHERPLISIASFRASAKSIAPDFVAQQERLFEGLRLAGLPETVK